MVDQTAPDVADFAIRPLSYDDLARALALSSEAGWNQRASDWRTLVDLAPDGCFAASRGEHIVGTALGIDYGGFSWVAMMLVDPAYRGRGLGRRLLAAVLDAVPGDTPVRLDATPMGRPLYLSCGFEDEVAITRWARDVPRPGAGSRPRLKPDAPGAGVHAVRSMLQSDLPALADHDREVFGGNRRTVLRWALGAAPEYAHVIENGAAAAPTQYCLGRHGRLFDQVGPVVASGLDAALALAGAALGAARTSVVMDVFDERRGFSEWVRARGFRPLRPLSRMRRPPRLSSAEGKADRCRPGPPQVDLRQCDGESADAFAKAEALPRDSTPDHQTRTQSLVEFAIFGPDFA